MNWRQIMLCIGLVAITGCTVPPDAPQPTPPPIATPTLAQPTSTPQPATPPPTPTAASVQSPNSPLPAPTATSTFSGTGPGAGPETSEAAVEAARLRLAKNGMGNPGLISVVGITPTTWPDDCLGLPSGTPCHLRATPGYSIELERDGQRYLFRTDQSGKQVRLAQSPVGSLADAFMQWQYSDAGGCKVAVIGIRQMHFGACGEAMLAASSETPMWPTVDGQSQASYIRQAYAPFTADTVRGTLVFSGTGTTVASQAEQRAIAEWAFTRFEEASFGYIPADFGLKLYWQEKSTSLCGTLWIYQTGLAVAWNCTGSEALGVGFLSGGQLQQFYTWLDSGKRWDVTRDSQVEGKPLHLTLQFPSSNSGATATAEETEAVSQFAHDIYVELSAHKPQ
jgi:hypothetical protein